MSWFLRPRDVLHFGTHLRVSADILSNTTANMSKTNIFPAFNAMTR
ncbi:hypothetical protein [Rhodobacter xanthinilyticus]|nr:hypothetical protein [Rhodobacter xanthinilyticus]